MTNIYLIIFNVVSESNCVEFLTSKNAVAASTLHQLLTGNWHAPERMENYYFKSPIDYRQIRIPSHFALIATLLGDEVTLLLNML